MLFDFLVGWRLLDNLRIVTVTADEIVVGHAGSSLANWYSSKAWRFRNYGSGVRIDGGDGGGVFSRLRSQRIIIDRGSRGCAWNSNPRTCGLPLADLIR